MKKILVIEDDESINDSIKEFLENEDFQVFSASNGREGLNLALKECPDLIVCDILMPGMNGYEVLSELSKKEADIPFIFLTAKIERDDIRKGMEIGADDYLTKPFKLEELLKAIEVRLMKRDRLNKAVSQQAPSTKEEAEEKDFLFITETDQPQIVKFDNIVCITASAEYTNVILGDGKKIFVRKLLKNWEESLPHNSFIRIHRSAIINLNFAKKVEKWFNNSYRVYLQNIQEPFVISRRQSVNLKKKLNI
jgi:DNA-binding LytR/AlgR family response regulator